MCHQNISSSDLGLESMDDTNSSDLVFLSFAVLMFPAIIFNIFAMIIFGKNLSTCSHHVSILLLVLACTDTMASVQGVVFHGFRIYRGPTSKAYCGVASFFESSFPLYSALIASLMAFDRYLALCKPFFYQSNISVFHGRLSLVWSGAFTVVICCLPYIGLGEYYLYIERETSTNSSGCPAFVLECSIFQRSVAGSLNVFGCVYGSVGLVSVVIVLICNGLVLKAVLKMKRVITTITSSEPERLLRSEMVFAKVIGGLSAVVVICWTPYMVSVICMSVGLELHPGTQKVIRVMAGFHYIADPFVYIFMRKKYRVLAYGLVQNLFRRRGPITPISREAREPDVPMSSVAPYF